MARARGLAAWQPRAKTLVLLEQVNAVLREYVEHLPLTIRQIFYRLVGAYGYPKGTSKDRRPYLRLGEMLNRARRAELVPWSAIRDDGFEIKRPTAWDGVDEVLAAVRATINGFRLDRQMGQRRRLLIAIEAQGMLPQIERIASPFGIPVVASGGFDSTSAKYGLSEFLSAMQAVEVLHIGDHDKEGQDIFRSLAEDVRKFCADYNWSVPEFTRLAVTAEQIFSLGLADDPDSPGKVQAEAIPPDVLADIVRGAIDARMDETAWQQVLAAEEHAKGVLLGRFADI